MQQFWIAIIATIKGKPPKKSIKTGVHVKVEYDDKTKTINQISQRLNMTRRAVSWNPLTSLGKMRSINNICRLAPPQPDFFLICNFDICNEMH